MDNELREKIAVLLHLWDTKPVKDKEFYDKADQILSLFKEAGYVKPLEDTKLQEGYNGVRNEKG